MKALAEEGFSVKAACFGVGISRSRYYELLADKRLNGRSKKQVQADISEEEVIYRLKAIKAEHPFWGYRRIWAWLRNREGLKINKKRVYRLMRREGLLVEVKRYKAKRRPSKRKPRAERPCQYWGIDMTKFWIGSMGWAYLVVVMDWFTKEIVGFEVSLRSRTEEWLRTMDKGFNKKFRGGVRGAKV